MRYNLCLLLSLAQLCKGYDGDYLIPLFRPALSPEAGIFLSADEVYNTEVTPRWSTFNDPSYIAAIKPETEEDVQSIVSIAGSQNISFIATGGGHGVKLGFSKVQHAINIDLSNLNSTNLDLDNNLVTVGAGVENARLYDLLSSVGKETALTSERCLNTIGPTLGGGLGPQYGLRGPLIDSLVSARLVTASGDVVDVSESKNNDLFWAIRGAGTNFGIVTSATYRIYPPINNGEAVSARFSFSPTANRSLFELMESMNEDYPPEMAGGIAVGYNHTSGQPTLAWQFLFTGSRETAQPWLDKITDLGPIDADIQTVHWHGRDVPESPFCSREQHWIMYNLNLARADSATLVSYFENAADFAASNPWFDCTLMFERQPRDAALALPESQRGVWPWRDSKVNMNFVVKTPSSAYDGAVDAFLRPVREQFQESMGYDTVHAYVNEALGDEGPAAWYGEHNLARLVELKQRWDPNSQFGAGAPIPLHL